MKMQEPILFRYSLFQNQ